MAKYWMHNGLMQASDEVGKLGGRNTRATEGDLDAQQAGKISKSKGSSAVPRTARPVLARDDPLLPPGHALSPAHRLQRRSGSARSRPGWRRSTASSSVTSASRGESFYAIQPPARRADGDFDPADDPLLTDVAQRRGRFLEAMDDDFNTGGAIGDLFELVRRLNKFIDDEKLEEPKNRDAGQDRLAAPRVGHVARAGGHVGTLPQARRCRRQSAGDALVDRLMKLLIELRAEARKKKDFATADRIRNSLAEMGVTLEDRPGGTEWSQI